MAKQRVYELARELNMTNKELLAKLQEMNVEVKNHMSTLSEEDISDIKKNLHSHAEKAAAYEAKRVKPNVIRRRRKRTAETTAESEAEKPGETTVSEPEEASAKEEPKPSAGDEQPEAAFSGAEETAATEAGEATQSPETGQQAETTAEPEVARPSPEAGKTEPSATETPEAAETGSEPLPETPEQEPPAGAELKPEAPEAPEQPEEPPAAKEEKEETVKSRAKKKRKKETPAKIIQMPEPQPEPKPESEQPAGLSPQEHPSPAQPPAHKEQPAEVKSSFPAKETESEPWKKGKRKKPDETEKPRKTGTKAAGLRRKEVVVGDALYDKSFGRGKKGRKKGKQPASHPSEQKTQVTTPKAIKRRIKVDDTIVIADLAKRMGIKANELIKTLMGMGMMVTVNQTIDFDTANLVAQEFNFEVERASFEEDAVLQTESDDPSQMVARPAVVTIMGHVDHGKTSLLDVIRRTKVTEGEAGGITQHIGAYSVELDSGEIVFLDTPGHEAFTSMRARGAQVTDLVILVVAADDGVMPQTLEAIDHARAAGVPIIVAVNKIDKNNAEPDRIKREVAEKGLVPEDWGGDTIFVNVSAKEQIGIDELLEMIVLQSEVLELKANPDKLARGHTIESKMDIGRGPVATLLVQEGTLKTGDSVVCGMYYGKIRAMYNDRGQPVQSAGPSYPVEIVGLSGVPMAGDEFITLSAEKDAKQVSEHRLHKQRSKDLARSSRLSLDKLYEKMMEGEVKDLNLIIKADVQGSIEALKDSLTKLSTEEVKISVVHSAAGPIHESDVSLATVSNAIILGFNVRPSAKVVKMAEEENVDIRYYDVIYNAIKDIKDAMVGLMESKFEERVLGRAEVREVFHVPSVGTIAGCYVTDGKIQRGQKVRLVRDGIVTFDGKIATLKRFKDDVKEVTHNYECGIRIENYNDIKIGDVLENYYLEEIKPEII